VYFRQKGEKMKKFLMTLMASMLLLSSTTYAVEMSKSHNPTMQMTTMSKAEAIDMLKNAGIEPSKIKMLENGEMAKTEGEWLQYFFRIGNSFSRFGNFRTFGIRWGSNRYYANRLPKYLRGPAIRLRNTRLPFNSWRTRDAGHFHFWRW